MTSDLSGSDIGDVEAVDASGRIAALPCVAACKRGTNVVTRKPALRICIRLLRLGVEVSGEKNAADVRSFFMQKTGGDDLSFARQEYLGSLLVWCRT